MFAVGNFFANCLLWHRNSPSYKNTQRFTFRLVAQYFFIRRLTAFLAAADIRFRRLLFGTASAPCAVIAGLTADPNGRCLKKWRSSAISASSSLIRACAPLRASSMMRDDCLAIDGG